MKHPFVFILIVACLASLVPADKNPCHGDYKYKSAPDCTQIALPPGLCSACTSGPEQFYTTGPNRGNYIDCTRTHDLTSDAQCLVKMKEYVEDNQCDTARRDGLGQYLSSDHTEKEEGRIILDYFIYSICENACDCIPQFDASPTVPAISIARGNCQAHAHYDVCRILPNIKVIKSSSKPWPEGSDSWQGVCPLLSSWISTPDGQNFLNVANTDVHPQVDTFFREFMDASQLLTDPTLYGNCLLLETAQGRVSESNEVTLIDTGTSTDTPEAPPVSEAPSIAPNGGTGPTKAPSVSESQPVTPNAGTGLTVTSFTLVNAADDTDMKAIKNGDTIYIQPGMEINIRADTSTDSSIGSVRFALNNNANFRTEDDAPYSLAGDDGGNYLVWQFGYGPQLLKAAPYSGSGASGAVGTPLEIAFTLTDTPIP